jgi:hypothetical protein
MLEPFNYQVLARSRLRQVVDLGAAALLDRSRGFSCVVNSKC